MAPKPNHRPSGNTMGPPPPNPNLMKPQGPPPTTQPTEDQVRMSNEVQRARDALYGAISNYRALLQESILPENRSKMQNDQRTKVLQELNTTHGELERVNVGEAPLALAFAALNAILGLKDEISQLKFQNTMLYKQIKQMREGDKANAS